MVILLVCKVVPLLGQFYEEVRLVILCQMLKKYLEIQMVSIVSVLSHLELIRYSLQNSC